MLFRLDNETLYHNKLLEELASRTYSKEVLTIFKEAFLSSGEHGLAEEESCQNEAYGWALYIRNLHGENVIRELERSRLSSEEKTMFEKLCDFSNSLGFNYARSWRKDKQLEKVIGDIAVFFSFCRKN